MYDLPTTITIDGVEHNIRNRADYRTILGVLEMLNDPDLTDDEKVVSALIVFYEEVDTLEDILDVFDTNIESAMSQMLHFVGGDDEDEIGQTTNYKLIDWQQDEKLIVSAINGVAKTEIRALEYLHWWTFISYYMAIGECPLSTVVGIRAKIAKGQKLDDGERRFRRENPHYFKWKKDEIEAKNMFDEIWNKG